MPENQPKGRSLRLLLVAACLVIIVAGLRAAGPILLPFLIAVLLTILSAPLLRFLTSRRVPLLLAVFSTVLVNFAVVVGIVLMIGGSLNAFADKLPSYQAGIGRMADSTGRWLEAKGIDTSRLLWLQNTPADGSPREPREDEAPPQTPPTTPAEESQKTVKEGSPTLFPTLYGLDIEPLVGFLGRTAKGVASLMTSALLVFLMMAFMLAEIGRLPLKLTRALGWSREHLARLDNARIEIQRYLGLKTAISLATGLLVGAWVAALGVDFPLLWGLLAFLLNYIPSLGSILAAFPPMLLTLIEAGPGRALAVGVGYLVVNLVLGNFLEPLLLGRRLGLSTLVVFLSMLFWGWLWGPVGMLMSAPLTVIIKIMLENTEDLRGIALLLGGNPRVDAP